MAAEAARVIEYPEDFIYGAAAPAREVYSEPWAPPADIPVLPDESIPAVRSEPAVSKAHGISLFTAFGAVFAAVLMIFVVLAHINLNEVTNETVRLDAQLVKLTDRESKLGIAYESVIDMKEVERYARDVLGMSKPDSNQVAIVQNNAQDKAEIIDNGNEGNALRGFGSFISSLLDYFRRG